MRILIAGAGDVGTRLGLLWAQMGEHEVWALRRSACKVPAPLRAIAADLTDPMSLLHLPAEIDLLYYTAAADSADEQAYRRAYVDGLKNILAAVSGPRKIVFVSSISVYGEDGGAWVDESSSSEPMSFRGRLLLEAEAVLHEAATSTTAVRLAGIYGPGRTRLIEAVRRGTAMIDDDPPRYTNRIHVEDCAQVLRHVATLPSPAATYLGVDHCPVSDLEIKTWLAETLGVAIPPRAPASRQGRDRRGGNKRCSNRRLLDSGYGFRFRDYKAGYGDLIGA